VTLTATAIKKVIGLSLTDEEMVLEKEVK
jgi:hypothetical protein